MKKLWLALFLLMGNEAVTYIILTVYVIMFLRAVMKQAEGRC